jgi:hypothetical protein
MMSCILFSGPVWSLDPYEAMDFRLFLGRIDGNESGALRDDSHRFSIGLGISSPIAWDGAVEANLEGWLTERSYSSTLSVTAGAAETMSFNAGSLSYGVRIHSPGAWRLYGLAAVGFQTSRLRTSITTGGVLTTVEEEITTTVTQAGAGIEYRHGEDLFSLDWRRWYGEGDFGVFQLRDVDLGGEFIGISLGHGW